jgi:hypothetical protein
MLDIQHEHVNHGLITLKAKSRCAACGKTFLVQLPVAAITNAPKYPVYHLILHGNPIHAFIRIGIGGADCGVSYFLPRQIGLSRATDIIMTGREVDPEEMLQAGFLAKLVDDDRVIDEALGIAASLLEKSPLGLRLTKEALVFDADSPSLEAALALEDRNQNICSQIEDS